MQQSVNQIASMYRGNPAPLQQRVQQDRQANQGLPNDLRDLLALQILTEEQDAASRQKAMQQLSQAGNQPTVAQSLQQRAKQAIQASNVQAQRQQEGIKGLMQQTASGIIPPGTPQPQSQPRGIDELPSNVGQFAGGGIVAFADGGETGYETPYDRMNRLNREQKNNRQVITLPANVSRQEAELIRMQNPDAKVVVEGEGALLKKLGSGVARALTYSSDVEAQKNRKQAAAVDNRALLNAADAALRAAPPQAPQPSDAQLPPAINRQNVNTAAPRQPAAPVQRTAPAIPVGLPAAFPGQVTDDRRRMMTEAMSRDPEEMARQMRARYEAEVGGPNVAGLEQLAQELQAKRAKMQERNKNIDPLVENLKAIANAPRGQKWMYSLLAGSEAVNKAREGREAQDFEMLKQIVDQQNKIEDVKRGYKGQVFQIGEAERARVYKDAFDAAKELGVDDRAAQQLAQEAVLRREQMAASEKISQRSAARENQSIAMNNEYRLKMVQARKLQDEGDVAGAAKLMAEANDILMLKGGAGSASVGSERNDISRKRLQIQTWEKIRDSSADPKAIEEAEQKIVQLARDIDKMESGGGAAKIMTQADVLATAKSSGKTPQQVIEAAKARGYTIQ